MTKPKIITNDDLINALPKERQDKINAEVEKTVAKWGGVRANSGRKRITGQVLDFTKRLTEKEGVSYFGAYKRTTFKKYRDNGEFTPPFYSRVDMKHLNNIMVL